MPGPGGARAAMPAPLSPPVTVRAGMLGAITDAGIFIALERGYYRELGLDVQIETITDPNTNTTLVGTNQLEVGAAGVDANPFQAAARGVGLKMVADKGRFFPGFSGVIVRQDLLDSGHVRSWADLKERTIAKLTQCDSSDPPLARGFERGGFTRDDINVVYMGLPDMNAALANKAIDAAWQIEPLSTLAQERGIAAKFAPGDELYPNQQIAVLFYSPEFAKRTDAAQHFMIAYVRGLRDYNDAFARNVGRAEVEQILAKYTPVKDLALYDRITPAGLDPDGRMNLQAIRDDLAFFARQGCVSGEIADVSQVVDDSFIDYALRVLGPYQRQ
jgi:NitT/TauT family transport system substrate-binding protein